METIKRINDMETKKKIMHQLLEVGEMLLSSGAISRVEGQSSPAWALPMEQKKPMCSPSPQASWLR